MDWRNHSVSPVRTGGTTASHLGQTADGAALAGRGDLRQPHLAVPAGGHNVSVGAQRHKLGLTGRQTQQQRRQHGTGVSTAPASARHRRQQQVIGVSSKSSASARH